MHKQDRDIEALPDASLTVFYDGACPLCSAEIGHYRRRRGAESIAWVDVSTYPQGTVVPGLTTEQARSRFYVQDTRGRLVSGGRAFAVLWSALPAYGLLGQLFRRQPFAWAIDQFYDCFLRWRPRLQGLARRVLTAR